MSDFEVLPSYDLKFFINGFKCKTHFKSIIEPETNQFKMEFEAAEEAKMIGHLKTINNEKIDNAVFIQRDYRTNNFVVEVSLRSKNIVKLCLFGDKKVNNTYSGIVDYQIKPQVPIEKAPLYCKVYSFPTSIYLYEPKENDLKIGNEYSFKVSVVALEIALVDNNKKWIYFNKDDSEENLWTIKYKPNVVGQLKLFVKISQDKSFSGAFEYSVLV